MDKDKKKKKSWLKFLFLGGFLLFLFKKEEKKNDFSLKDLEHNFLDFTKEEGKEVDELIHHKEDVEEYVEDSKSIFRDYFIPHKGNNHHPKIFRKKQLLSIVILALLLKVSLVSYLFFIYPNDAKMAEDIQTNVFNMLNKERVADGLDPLKLNKSLLASATDRAEDMINNDYFAHKSPDGRMPWDFVSRRDYPYLYIGENLGMGFLSAESVHKALMESPSHKKNILNKKYTDVGVIVKKGIINGKETNILVQLFGSEKKTELIPNPVVAIATAEDVKTTSKTDEVEVSAEEFKKVEDNKTEFVEEKKQESVKNSAETTDESFSAPEQDGTDTRDSENIAQISTEKIDILKQKIESLAKVEKEPIKSSVGTADESFARDSEGMSSTSPLMLGDKAKSFIEKKVVEPDLSLELNKKIEFVSAVNSDDKYTIAARISDYFNILLLGVLVLMTVALFINIFVKLKIQHKPVLIQAFLLLILLLGIYSTRINFLEKIPDFITIF